MPHTAPVVVVADELLTELMNDEVELTELTELMNDDVELTELTELMNDDVELTELTELMNDDVELMNDDVELMNDDVEVTDVPLTAVPIEVVSPELLTLVSVTLVPSTEVVAELTAVLTTLFVEPISDVVLPPLPPAPLVAAVSWRGVRPQPAIAKKTHEKSKREARIDEG